MSEKQRILFITPHLSTGGAPQVTLNKIELLKDEYNILCVEYSFIAWSFVVQRNKIINLLGDNFISLPEDKTQILNASASVRCGFDKQNNLKFVVRAGTHLKLWSIPPMTYVCSLSSSDVSTTAVTLVVNQSVAATAYGLICAVYPDILTSKIVVKN